MIHIIYLSIVTFLILWILFLSKLSRKEIGKLNTLNDMLLSYIHNKEKDNDALNKIMKVVLDD